MQSLILPTINATLNFTAGVLLTLGKKAIKSKNDILHRKFMIAALCCSAIFLICYVTHHILLHGVVTHYQGQGIFKIIYFFILATHTPLAMIIVPASLLALKHALAGQYDKHTKITRWLYPVWMYVSVTGVLIYLMLYIFK